MDIESKIEDAKISLAINPDFNCEDAFRLFESNDKGFLDKDDIEDGLNLIGIFPTRKELNLLMRRFDLQKNGYINFADFFDMVIPFEKSYRQRVENRPPQSCCPCRSPDVFSSKTVYYLKNMFNLIISCENEINNDRKLLGTVRLKLNEIFGLLDKDGKGYFENNEMMEYFYMFQAYHFEAYYLQKTFFENCCIHLGRMISILSFINFIYDYFIYLI